MQQAVPVGAGAMAALIGLDLDAASAIAVEAAEGEVCAAANDNGAGQVVVSGNRAAVERAVELAKAKGAKRAVLLTVSAPFHCALMASAAAVMEAALAAVTVNPPVVPLVANVTARPVTNPEEIRANLVRQVTSMVRWRELIEWMSAAGVDRFVEVGSGKVLSGLARRIADGAKTLTVGSADDVAAALPGLT